MDLGMGSIEVVSDTWWTSSRCRGSIIGGRRSGTVIVVVRGHGVPRSQSTCSTITSEGISVVVGYERGLRVLRIDIAIVIVIGIVWGRVHIAPRAGTSSIRRRVTAVLISVTVVGVIAVIVAHRAVLTSSEVDNEINVYAGMLN